MCSRLRRHMTLGVILTLVGVGSSQTSRLRTITKRPTLMGEAFRFGRSGEARTPGLMVPNHARYQLRYTSKVMKKHLA